MAGTSTKDKKANDNERDGTRGVEHREAEEGAERMASSPEQGTLWQEVAKKTSVQETGGASYPVLQYHNGNPQMPEDSFAHTGGFLITDEQNIVPKGDAWERVKLRTKDGKKTIEGFGARQLSMTMIRTRKAWNAEIDGLTIRYPWGKFKEAKRRSGSTPRSHTQTLVRVDGVEEVMALTLKGVVGMALSDKVNGSMYNNLKDRLILPANKASSTDKKKMRLGPFAFRVIVGAGRKPDGTTDFVTVGEEGAQSTIVPLMLFSPNAKLTAKEAEAFYVGHEQYESNQLVFNGAQEWVDLWNVVPDVDAMMDNRDEQYNRGGNGGNGGSNGRSEGGYGREREQESPLDDESIPF